MIENKLDNFLKALKRLNEMNVLYKSKHTEEAYQDALIKRYEIAFELAWKTLKTIMQDENFIESHISSPTAIIKKAHTENFIINEEIWLDMLSTRNNIIHTYNEKYAKEVAIDISTIYIKKLSELAKTIRNH